MNPERFFNDEYMEMLREPVRLCRNFIVPKELFWQRKHGVNVHRVEWDKICPKAKLPPCTFVTLGATR
jgi:hypothetical protein